MEKNTDISDLDYFMIINLINILNIIDKEKKFSTLEQDTINYILEKGYIPLKYRIRDMVEVFILEYIITEKTESNILNLKDKWVNKILISARLDLPLTEKEYIYNLLNNSIISCNKVGIEVKKNRILNKLNDLEEIIEPLRKTFQYIPNFNILFQCIYNYNPLLAVDIMERMCEVCYFLTLDEVIEKSDISDIVDSQKGRYERKYGLIPRVKDFARFLFNKKIFPIDVPTNTIKELLAEHVINELDTFDVNLEKAQAQKQTLIDVTPQQTSFIETKEKIISEKSIYDLPEDFEMENFHQVPFLDDDIQFSVPRILDKGEECFWVHNNIAGLEGIKDELFICETQDDCGYEEDGFMFNRTGEGVEKEPDGREYTFKTWLRISDEKYYDFINKPIDDSFDSFTMRNNPNVYGLTGLERAIFHEFEGWSFGKFAFNILFCDFVQSQEKGKDAYYKIVPKYLGEPDLQFFVEEELKLIADENSYIPLITIPYFFKYHFDKSKNVIEFLRNAIKTTNNAWGTTPLSILCKNSFTEWLEHIIKEYKLNREEIFRQPTTSATVESKNLVLFQREIALIYHYENWLLTDENANDEVRKYLQKDGTRHKSGKSLMADYRIVNGEFKDWLNQKVTIKYLKKVIPLLQNTKGINDAKSDLEQAIKNRESLF